MNKALFGKSIVVIGGTGGMGLSASKTFIEQGANVVAVGLSPENVQKAQEVLGNTAALAIAGSATEENTAINAIEECIRRFGSFDGLYHVAGGSGRKFGDGPLHDMTVSGWEQTLNLNLTSLMLSNKAAVNYFIKNKKAGTILNMGSVLGYSPSPRYFVTHAYAAAKSAIIGFSKSIASYYATHNIRINVIAPALVETPMAKRAAEDEVILDFIHTKQPLEDGRIGKPEDLDGLAVYFMSDLSKFTTGQVIAVDGGWTITEGQYDNK
jgi:NAD(P)-dependent dehydrogenase (short-subunit alcohol dehydrogenase family)